MNSKGGVQSAQLSQDAATLPSHAGVCVGVWARVGLLRRAYCRFASAALEDLGWVPPRCRLSTSNVCQYCCTT